MRLSTMKLIANAVLALSLFAVYMPVAHADNINSTQAQASFVEVATIINTALSNQQYELITPYIHPKKGVRFSMYAYINPNSDKVFSQADFKKYLKQSRIKFTWGEKEGAQNLYVETLPNYLNHWVVRQHEFQYATPYINTFKGYGNSLNNLAEQYPNADFVEFYYSGTPHWEYMDWRALRLVFETYKGHSYLVALITDEWTI